MTRVKLTYFKQSGKYYCNDEFESDPVYQFQWNIFEEVRKMRDEKRLPGLTDGSGFNILVQFPDSDMPPGLIMV